MPKTLIGYARCSTDKQDLTAQREALNELGVAADRIYVDHGLTGTNRSRPGLNQALAAVRHGDTLIVPKLDRLARSVPDARSIADELAARGVTLALGQSRYDPSDPMGKMFFNILATFAEFEADLMRMHTREGMAIARAKGKLKVSDQSSRTNSRRSFSACMEPENIPSATWGSCSLFPAQRFIGLSLASSVSDSTIWLQLRRTPNMNSGERTPGNGFRRRVKQHRPVLVTIMLFGVVSVYFEGGFLSLL